MSSAQIIPLVSETAVDDAWNAYRAHKAKELTDPHLMLDRVHMEESAMLHATWLRLFLMGRRSAEVLPFDRGRG